MEKVNRNLDRGWLEKEGGNARFLHTQGIDKTLVYCLGKTEKDPGSRRG